MLGRIYDMSKALSDIERIEEEAAFSGRLLELLTRMQENIVQGKRINLKWMKRAVDNRRNRIWEDGAGAQDAFPNKLGYYNFYGFVQEYLEELEHFLLENAERVMRQLTYTSIDRPGLIAEISGILVKYGLNITGVSITVNGEFATTTIEVACRFDFEHDLLVREVRKVDQVLEVEFA